MATAPLPTRAIRATRAGTACARLAWLACAASLVACSSSTPSDVPAISKVDKADGRPGAAAKPSVPPENGPKLVVTARLDIVAKPEPGAAVIGEARAGSELVRSAQAHGTKGCDGGWYAVRPRGYVCLGAAASLELTKRARLPAPADLARALPYRYARTRGESTPVYGFVPSPEVQRAAERDLEKHLKRAPKLDAELLGPSANDVPLDARGLATGPAVLLPGGEGIDETGKRVAGRHFLFPADFDLPARLPYFPFEPVALPAPLRKGSGVAVIASHEAEGPSGLRRFAVLSTGERVPVDRLRPALATTFHGADLEGGAGLPIAFVRKPTIATYSVTGNSARKEVEELERRTTVPLTGRFRTIDRWRFEETREGFWVRAQDIVNVVKRSKFPEFARDRRKWLDVSLTNQTVTAYEGRKPVFVTMVSTGRDLVRREADGAAEGEQPTLPPDEVARRVADVPVTARGTFKITSKAVSAPVDAREVNNDFDLAEAPWVLGFAAGHAVTGTYWTDAMGEAQTFHNVALSPIDARRIWMWADPPMPEGWHRIDVPESEAQTIVYVHL